MGSWEVCCAKDSCYRYFLSAWSFDNPGRPNGRYSQQRKRCYFGSSYNRCHHDASDALTAIPPDHYAVPSALTGAALSYVAQER